jgi:lipopolysaccharide/colanic/teichoic acid biosynthesis glycosyltransferase
MKKRTIIFLAFDILFVFLAFMLAAFFKTGKEKALFNYYWMPFLIFELVWVGSSLIFGKYNPDKSSNRTDYILSVVKSNLFILFSITFIIFFASLSYSRLIIVLTVAFATILEGFSTYFFIHDKQLNKKMDDIEKFVRLPRFRKDVLSEPSEVIPDEGINEKRQLIQNEVGVSALNFIESSIHLGNPEQMLISTTTKFNVLNQPKPNYQSIVNLKRINDILRINKFFEAINTKLQNGGLYINYVETYSLRKKRILKKFPAGINWIVYSIDFSFKRIMPKLWSTKKIYFILTKGRNRVMSKAETFGRLYSCGFEIVEEKMINDVLYFVARKVSEPVFDDNPTYGPLIKLRRFGKGGKKIGVYKMRTMHPYSEYLQEYIYERNKLQEGGKFADDFRITSVGKFMRKFWLDELPMFLNVFKGEMKIVGVRPLSSHYFSLYTEELKEKRLKYKPGLIPPFYVDMPVTLEEIMASEMKYLEAYEKHPFRTDISYFFKALYNIFIKRARSN